MAKHRPLQPTPVEPGAYTRLPEPIRVEEMITSAEIDPAPEEKDDYWREVEWMLRVAGAG